VVTLYETADTSGIVRLFDGLIGAAVALIPRFGHREIGSDHRVLIVVRPRNGGVGAQDAIARRLAILHSCGMPEAPRPAPWPSSGTLLAERRYDVVRSHLGMPSLDRPVSLRTPSVGIQR